MSRLAVLLDAIAALDPDDALDTQARERVALAALAALSREIGRAEATRHQLSFEDGER